MAKSHTKINPACIFCGEQKDTQPIFFPPLEYQFKPVCKDCLPTLDRFISKYPELWDM